MFGAYRLDLVDQRLWRGDQAIPLSPKDFAVLLHLLRNAGRLVTKEELLDAVWPETAVGDAVLKVSIQQVRAALGDDPKSPQFIETAHRRGYRFVGKVGEGSVQGDRGLSSPAPFPRFTAAPSPARVVGRKEALGQMKGWLEKALQGRRQLVFVTGEAGIGKTTLVEAFLEGAADPSIWIGHGQCLDHYGVGEAYLPVLDAVSRLCRDPMGQRLGALMGRHAPTWMAQMSWFAKPSDRGALQPEVLRASHERMLREMAETVEALTADTPLVLVLEDLHWSDYSTLDLISYLAQRREPARLLLIGTYRPVEVVLSGHPLKTVKQELQMHGFCHELAVEFLSESAVGAYLAARFPEGKFPPQLARVIHKRTDGSPLFMVNVVDYLVAEGLIGQREGRWALEVGLDKIVVVMPEGIKQMIDKQIDHLSKEHQRVLEAVSVVGLEFQARAVAAGLQEDVVWIEEQCDELARRHQFIRATGMVELPDGTATACYRFIHALYQNALHDRVAMARRIQLHQRIGEHAETVYGERAGEIAAELAMHFEQGRDYPRAVRFLQQAAENAGRRFANHETVALSRRALELLKTLPETPERTRHELILRITLGVSLIATDGYAALEVEQNYSRARELCQQQNESPELFAVLWGLWAFYLLREELGTALTMAQQLLGLGEIARAPILLVEGHWALGVALAYSGEFTVSLEHLERAIAFYEPAQYASHIRNTGHDPAVASRCQAAWVLWSLGHLDQALIMSREALALAEALGYPHSLTMAEYFAAQLHQFRRETEMCRERAEATMGLATEHGLMDWMTLGTIQLGWALAEQGQVEKGMAEMRRGLAEYKERGAELRKPYFLGMLADLLRKAGHLEESISVLDEALATAHRTTDSFYEAELYRLKGEALLMQPTRSTEAEGCLRQAVEISRRQQAKSWELRAMMSLCRLRQRQSKQKQARRELEATYAWFAEGLDTGDLKEAKGLLEEL